MFEVEVEVEVMIRVGGGCLSTEVLAVECLCLYFGGFKWTAESEAHPGLTDFHAADFGRIFDLTLAQTVDRAK